MMKVSVITLISYGAVMTAVLYGFESESAILKNKDSRSYDYIIKTACDRNTTHDEAGGCLGAIYDCGIYYGKIESRSQSAVCSFGCELTLTTTGQTITVEPGDTIVIRKGVLQVR